MTTIATRALPRTGQRLTTLGMGGAPLGGLFEAGSAASARATVDAAWHAGIRYFDTAPYYGYTLSEHRMGEALREQPRDSFVLETKVGRLLDPLPPQPSATHGGGARKRGDAWASPLPFAPRYDYSGSGLRRSIEDSLQRLGTNRIDIALVHDIGSVTHGDAHAPHWAALTGTGLRELEAMKREGLIGAFGLGVNEWEVISDALDHADLDISMLAGRYTLLEQASLHPFLDQCLSRQVGIVVGGPFNSGVLAAADPEKSHFDYESVPPNIVARVKALGRVCRSHGVPLPAAALQFPLAHPAIVSVVPGPRSAAQLSGIVDWWQLPIPAALWAELKAEGLLAEDAPTP